MEMKFYRCSVCGKIIAIVKGTGVPTVCCGKPMEAVVPNTVDAAMEKHVPVCEAKNGEARVTVGSALHPMTEEHHIEWVAVETKFGNQRKALDKTGEPKACFALCEGDEVLGTYAYCNLHGLWKA